MLSWNATKSPVNGVKANRIYIDLWNRNCEETTKQKFQISRPLSRNSRAKILFRSVSTLHSWLFLFCAKRMNSCSHFFSFWTDQNSFEWIRGLPTQINKCQSEYFSSIFGHHAHWVMRLSGRLEHSWTVSLFCKFFWWILLIYSDFLLRTQIQCFCRNGQVSFSAFLQTTETLLCLIKNIVSEKSWSQMCTKPFLNPTCTKGHQTKKAYLHEAFRNTFTAHFVTSLI